MRRWLVRPFVWLLLLLLAIVASNILFFSSRYARESAAELLRGELSDALGREVGVSSVDFHLWTLEPSFELRGLVIPGPRLGEPAVMRVGLARARVSWRALAERRLEVEQLDLERPQLYLRINPDGSNNLPRLRRRNANQPGRVQLSIGRVLVQNGTFQLNERRARLDLAARAVWVRLTEAQSGLGIAAGGAGGAGRAPGDSRTASAAGGAGHAGGAGNLGAPGGAAGLRPGSLPGRAPARAGDGGRGTVLDFLLTAQAVSITLPDARPYSLTLSARGRVDSGQVRIAAARLSGPDLAARVDGVVSWAGDNEVDLGISAQASSSWVNRVGYLAEPIDGRADLAGRFIFRREAWEYSGRLRSARVHVLRRDFRDLAADFRGDPQQLTVDVRHALYDEATLSGPVVVLTGARPAPGSRRGGRPVELDLAIRGLALPPFLAELFPRQFAGPGPPVVEIAARASGRLRYRFQSSDWQGGNGQAALHLEPPAAGDQRARGLPLTGEVPLRMDGGVLTAGTVQVSAPGQEAAVTGFTYGLRSGSGRLQYRLVSHDTGALAPLFPPGPPRLPTAHWVGPRETLPIWLPNSGHGTAAGMVTIDPRGYSARFDLDLLGVVDHSLGSADRLYGTLTLEPRAVENLRLEATAGRGALMVSGRIPLAPAGRALPDEPLDLAIDAAQWPADGLVPYLPAWFPVAGLRGEASGRVDLGGDFVRLTGQADADIAGLVLAGVALGRVRGQMAWDPARIAISDGVVENAAGRLLAHGSFERAGGGLDLTLDAPAVELGAEPVAGLLRLPGLTGRVALMATAGGTLERPTATLSLRGQGLSYGGRQLAGAAAGEAQVVASWDGELVRAQGTVGNLLTFDGGGRLDRRQAALRLDLRSANLAGLIRLAVPSLPAPVAAAQPAAVPVAAPVTAAAAAASSAIAAAAPASPAGASGAPASPSASPGMPAAQAASPGAPAPPAGALGVPASPAPRRSTAPGATTAAPADFAGSLAGSLGFTADFAAARYHGELRLDELRLTYGGRQVANREPVVVDVSPERLEVRSFYLGEAGTDLEAYAAGTVGLVAPMALDLHAQSTISATWARLFAPDLDVAGAVDALVTLRGTVGAPDLSGQAVLRDARVVLPSLATLDGLAGTVRFYRDRLVLDELTGRLGGGTVHASGQVALPGNGRTPSYRIDMAAEGVSLRYPEGWVSRGDVAVSLVGGGVTRQLVGSIRLNRALYVENLKVDPFQLLLRGLQRERVQVTPTNALFAATQLNLAIRGPGALRITNNVADLHGDIDLTVAGTIAAPVVFGSVQLEPGGTLEYSDNKYQVERGILTFANPNRIDPIIDLALKAEVQSYEITLTLTGTLEKLNAKFASNADLADIDILLLLANGQRPEIGAPPPPGPQGEAAGHAAASQFLAGQASSALGSRVGRLFGLDRFRVDTQTLTQAGVPTSGVVITAGKRLSKNIFITYVSNPSSPRLDVRQIEWQVAKNLTVLLTQSGSSYAVDVQRETRF